MKIFKYFLILFIFSTTFSVFENYAQDKRPDNWAKQIKTNYFKNLYQLNDSIFRSEQPDEKGFKILDSIKIKSILSLRSSFDDSKLTGNIHFNFFQIGMIAENINHKDIIFALKVIKESPKPLLIHCVHGADRTGVVVAMYRIIFEGWTKKDAIDEMKNGNYHFHKAYQNIIEFIKTADIEKIKKKISESN